MAEFEAEMMKEGNLNIESIMLDLGLIYYRKGSMSSIFWGLLSHDRTGVTGKRM